MYDDVCTSYVAACTGVSKERLNAQSSCSFLVICNHHMLNLFTTVRLSNPYVCNTCIVNMHVSVAHIIIILLCMCVDCIGVGGTPTVACDSEL